MLPFRPGHDEIIAVRHADLHGRVLIIWLDIDVQVVIVAHVILHDRENVAKAGNDVFHHDASRLLCELDDIRIWVLVQVRGRGQRVNVQLWVVVLGWVFVQHCKDCTGGER